MRKAAKRKVGSKAGGRKGAVSESQNDEVMAQSTQEEIQPLAEEKENEIGGELAKGDQEDHDDEAKDASPSQQQEDDKTEDKKKGGRRGGKRKRDTNKETEKNDGKKAAPRAKRARATKSTQEEQPEYFEEKRNLEDLWKTAFPVGSEWHLLDSLYEFNWDFKHLEEALEEGGMLYGKKVFVFVNTEPQFILCKDVNKVVPVPTVVVVAVASVQGASEKIIPMKEMKMEWVPYIPLENRDRQIDRMNFQIVRLVCTQRRAALRHLKEDRVRKFDYCLPYFYQPFEEDEIEKSTVVQILFPSEPPVVCVFDWKFDKLEEFVDDLIEAEELSAEQKDEFKEFVKEQVRAAKKAIREAKAARLKAIEEMSEDKKGSLTNIKFYKFYQTSQESSRHRSLTDTTGKLIMSFDNGTLRTQNSFSW